MPKSKEASNQEVILNKILEVWKHPPGNNVSKSDKFQSFAFEHILKDYEPSYDDIEFGDVDGGSDGGIDGWFTLFDDNRFLQEAVDSKDTSHSEPSLNLIIVQAKYSKSVKESIFEKLESSLKDLLASNLNTDDLSSLYSEKLLERRQIFSDSRLELEIKHVKLTVTIIVASCCEPDDIHPNVKAKAEKLKKLIPEYLSSNQATSHVEFIGPKWLIEEYHKQVAKTSKLDFEERISGRIGEGHILLVDLEQYVKFIADDKYKRKMHMFDANVREFQGMVEVNREIANTLEQGDNSIDFWWRNNGVTMLVSKATFSARSAALSDVQIVNGLQTSESLCRHKQANKDLPKHLIMIKVVVVPEDARIHRDAIIKATNHQTRIPDASLWATDAHQREIETFLLHSNIYYERRKNYYKNQGKSAEKIVSIEKMAQLLAAIVLREPHTARGFPSSLLKTQKNYKRIFSSDIPVCVYLHCIQIMELVEKTIAEDYSSEERNNLRFHAATAITIALTGSTEYKPKDVAGITIPEQAEGTQIRAVALVFEGAKKGKAKKKKGNLPSLAKTSTFTANLLDKLSHL